MHFGLGAESKVNHVEIRWPSGIVQRIEKPTADQILKVKEAEQKAEPKAR